MAIRVVEVEDRVAALLVSIGMGQVGGVEVKPVRSDVNDCAHLNPEHGVRIESAQRHAESHCTTSVGELIKHGPEPAALVVFPCRPAIESIQ